MCKIYSFYPIRRYWRGLTGVARVFRMTIAEAVLAGTGPDAVLNALPHPVIVVTADGKFAEANVAAELVF